MGKMVLHFGKVNKESEEIEVHPQRELQTKEKYGVFLYRLLSAVISAAAVAIVYLLQIPNPMMLLIIPVVLFTYLEGYVSGGISGCIAVVYSVYFFLFHTKDDAAGQKLFTIVLAIGAIVLLAGRLKERNQRSIAELKQAEERLIQAKEEAEGLARVKSDFLSMMSHEIRSPMNAIIGMANIAGKSSDPDKIKDCLHKIDDASQHLLGVINDILDMSKIEAGKLELSEADFLLADMFERIINVNQIRFEEKSQEFTIAVDPGVPPAVIADQQRLIQVITNLLSNATKFTPKEGKIELAVHLQEW